MGLEDFATSNDSATNGAGGSDHHEIDASMAAASSHKRWHTRIDFSNPYIVVARDRKGEVYKHEGDLAILDDNDDWRRLDDHPSRELEIIFTKGERRDWLRFCDLCVDQMDLDPRDVLTNDPGRLPHIEDRLDYPQQGGFDTSRTCQVCGESSESNKCTMVELDLHKHRMVAVCASHSVEELAHNGLLQ